MVLNQAYAQLPKFHAGGSYTSLLAARNFVQRLLSRLFLHPDWFFYAGF
jgi:hypothetical protein